MCAATEQGTGKGSGRPQARTDQGTSTLGTDKYIHRRITM